jgi:Flp pilus assembly protein TadB
MLKSSLSAATAIALLAGAAVAKEKPADAPKEKKICKSVKTTSSRIASKRVCKTAEEWAQASSQEELDDSADKLSGMGRNN